MRARRYLEAKLFAEFMSQIGAELPAKPPSDEPSAESGIARRSAPAGRAGGQERTICRMWHRKMTIPGGASSQSGMNHLRNMASQDDPPWRSEEPIRNEPSAEYGIARRPALMERVVGQ